MNIRQLKKAARSNMRRNGHTTVRMAFCAVLPEFIIHLAKLFNLAASDVRKVLNGTFSFTFSGILRLEGASHTFSQIFDIVSILVMILIISVTTVGMARFFLKSRVDLTPFASEPYAPFREGGAGHIIWVLFTKFCLIAFGFLLIIPGIIFSFRYALVEQVLAVNPDITAKHARELSAQLMKGHWLEYFLLQLSFLGWYILGELTLGFVWVLYVNPYIQATLAEFYVCRRAELIDRKKVTSSKLPAVGGG